MVVSMAGGPLVAGGVLPAAAVVPIHDGYLYMVQYVDDLLVVAIGDLPLITNGLHFIDMENAHPLLEGLDAGLDMGNAYPPLGDDDEIPGLELMGVPQGSAESVWAGIASIVDSDDDMPDEDIQNECVVGSDDDDMPD